MRDIFEIKFESRPEHRKGMDTEDSVLRATEKVCKSLSIGLLRRIMPPRESGIGECDAVVFSDSGVLVIEAKRFGGEIETIDLESDTIRIRKGKKQDISVVNNPAKLIAEKTRELKRFMDSSGYWYRARKLFEMAGLREGIPVYPVLVFGPSTKILEGMPENYEFLLCNTRTIQDSLKSFITSHPGVLGISKLMGLSTHNWRSVGKLTAPPNKGFLRAYPTRADGAIVSFAGIVSIEGTSKGVVKLLYSDKTKRITKEIKGLTFRVNAENRWEDVSLKTARRFKWTCSG